MSTIRQLVDATADPEHIFNRPAMTWQEEDAQADLLYAEEQLYFLHCQEIDECWGIAHDENERRDHLAYRAAWRAAQGEY